MVALTEKMDNTTWTCAKYGTSMLASHAEDFCARRYSAANHEDACGISFSHCRRCNRGEAKCKLAKRRDAYMSGLSKRI